MDVLAHASPNEPSIEDCKEQVRRIIHSAAFRNAATLQQLFQFLTDKAINGSAESLKEYTIGVEALGRKPDFDPKIDPIVRVQSHRLRVKLKEYYEEEGDRDPVLIRFPKGHYTPTFEWLPAPLLAEQAHEKPETDEDTAEEPLSSAPVLENAGNSAPFRWKFTLFLTFFAIGLLLLGYWFGSRQQDKGRWDTGSTASATYNNSAAEAFWARFLGNDSSPVIAYTDAVFLLDDSNDLFRFRHGAIDSRGASVDPHVAREFASNPGLVAQAGQLYYENGYTGTGELEAATMLGELLGHMGMRPIIKSSRDVTPDDLNQHNVILLGSSFQNSAVAQLMTAADFSYSNPDQRREQWRAQILNAHPQNGEASAYGTERDETTKVLKADYGLITIAPGVTPGRWIAIIGGLDTKGTQGAARFMTSRHGVENLNKILDGISNTKAGMVPFQALVHVQLAKGYQVLDTKLVSVHPIQSAKADASEAATPAH